VSRSSALLLSAVIVIAAAFVWNRWSSEEAAIERRLYALSAEIN
jgi:hypothetical protein